MSVNSATYDIFIAYDRRDSETAAAVADILRNHQLLVFFEEDELPNASNVEDQIWQAMAESRALVVILPEDVRSSWLNFELGAARAWNKPIFAVSEHTSHRNLPLALRDISVLPPSRVGEIAHAIAASTDPLSDQDLTHLTEAYASVGLSADRLLLQPNDLEKLVKRFNTKSGRQMSGEQVMWHLLRLRKKGQLPVQKRRTSVN